MRRIPAALAVLGLTALALVGCSTSGGSASCERTPQNPQALDAVSVSGDTDTEPTVTLDAALYVGETSFADLDEGHGLPITSAAQDVALGVTVFNGATGEKVAGVGYDADSTVLPLALWEEAFPGFSAALHCAAAGTRVAMLLPTDEIAEDTRATLALADGASAVVVVDVRTVYLAAANGTPQFNDRAGMPSVVLAPNGQPGVTIPDSAPPDELVVQVLKKGDGEKVTDDAQVRIQYTGLTWATGDVFDSSWERGQSQSLTLASTIPGFAQALEGQTVGSQILAVIPPDLGYGDQDQGTIPAGSTLVFVVDILGLDEVSTG
ncbi:FKBP-type peptidyl-prolyl cis-trans isomerase [Microbacterium sp.]|uniref:FKBP-type peptidyl-prolyl cis-trans isomerase n=1 Tax=Microbacterium sp. TaxID=51671 RepID=UPI0039E3C5BB